MQDLLFSGVQPSGDMHIGNFLGTMQSWLCFQQIHKALFCVVDLHAITMAFEPKILSENVLRTTAFFLACGLDPEKCIIFRQSDVPQHSELMWIFSCLTSKARLGHMIQFKEKSQQNLEPSTGLFTYPLLMAADILLYNAKFVPVGKDQTQHLELTREISRNFNRKFKTDFFVDVQPIIPENSAKIMSLQDGSKKMSKSDDSSLSCIFLADSPDEIKKKISKSKTDSYSEVNDKNLEERPELKNLLNIYAAFAQISFADSLQKCSGKRYGDFKKMLTELLIEKLQPIREKFINLIQDQDCLKQILQDGAEKSSLIAEFNLKKIKEIIGLM